jgi:hypothetical protein
MRDGMSPSNRGAGVHVIKLSSTLSAEHHACVITTDLASPGSIVADESRLMSEHADNSQLLCIN